MNFRKVFASLILSVATLGAFACQYVHNDLSGSVNFKRCLYLSGINAPGNHISGITVGTNSTVIDGTDSPLDGKSDSTEFASYEAKNHVVVSLPLTVYVGVADLESSWGHGNSLMYDFGSEMQNITIAIQYRVLPETTWHTAATKKFSSGNLRLISKQKLFGSLQIDAADAPAGSTMIVRMYVSVARYGQEHNGFYANFMENADTESDAVTSAANIPESSTCYFNLSHSYWGLETSQPLFDNVEEENANTPTNYYGSSIYPGLHFDNRYLNQVVSPGYHEGYVDGWTPQFVMIVKIANKRRPGK